VPALPPSSPPLKAEKFVRLQPNVQRIERSLTRRRSGALAMACVALATLAQRRLTYDSVWFMSCEAVICTAAIVAAGWLTWQRPTAKKEMIRQRPKLSVLILITVWLVAPWVINVIAKRADAGNGLEIVMLGTLAWTALACAWLAARSRTISLSVICSGFTALFATLISDASSATLFSYAWVALCMWWLVGNHWEGLESQAAVRVDRTGGMRWLIIALGVLVFSGSALALGNRVPVLRKLHAELMPTSGGTSHKDRAARSGVGNGDALIAAKNHATSFGAVETDVFLESEKPSLFDVFSEEFGEPKRNERVERAQALSQQDVLNEEGRYSETNRSSSDGEFAIERQQQQRKPAAEDLTSNALFFWQGEANAHLAVQRFRFFDGVRWTKRKIDVSEKLPVTSQAVEPIEQPESLEVDGQTWFFARGDKFSSSLSPYVGAMAEAAKFTRFGSAVIPSRCGTKLWCIDMIHRGDFFHYEEASDCLSMPGREHVPDYTVVRFVNGQLDVEKMEQLLQHCSPGQGHVQGAQQCRGELASLAHDYSVGSSRGWKQVNSVIAGLRKNFRHQSGADGDATEVGALERFLRSRSGPSYLFATAAALMLEHLGYETRLVTGFYVNRKHYIVADDEYAIQSSDAHVWLEVNAGHGYWLPLEPTPGYLAPRTTASMWYRVVQARWQIAGCLLGCAISLSTMYWLRGWLFDLVVWCCSPALKVFTDRLRVRWLARVLDVRLALIGSKRPPGAVLRRHMADSLSLPEREHRQLRMVLDGSDGLLFGNHSALSAEQRNSIYRLWRELTVSSLRKVRRAKNTS
jgi:hypothetical protein